MISKNIKIKIRAINKNLTGKPNQIMLQKDNKELNLPINYQIGLTILINNKIPDLDGIKNLKTLKVCGINYLLFLKILKIFPVPGIH